MSAKIQNFIHRHLLGPVQAQHRAVRGIRLSLGLALLLAACSPPQELRGNLPDPEAIAQITPGKTTKVEVTRLLGSPSNISTFDTGVWYYIARRSVRDALSEAQLVGQTIYVVQFDDAGIVKSFQQQDNNDKAVAMIPRTTPASGKELSIIEQLLGNFGKFANSDDKKKGGS